LVIANPTGVLNICQLQTRNKHPFSDNVDIIGEPIGYELGVGDEFMDFAQEFKSDLNEKIDKETVAIKLLVSGYMQAYIDFFYLTNDTTPSYIQESEELA
jgi:hypothetical protein